MTDYSKNNNNNNDEIVLKFAGYPETLGVLSEKGVNMTQEKDIMFHSLYLKVCLCDINLSIMA